MLDLLQGLNVGFNDAEDDLINHFRAKAQSKFDNKKGAIKKALLEAIGNWVKAN